MFGKIGMVILLVSDMHKLITFYRDVLGMITKGGKRPKASGANSRCENAYSVIRI